MDRRRLQWDMCARTCALSLLRGVSLTSGAVSDTAAVHWYSNDPSIWYVGFNKITSEIVMLSRFATLFRLASPESIAIADIQVNYAKIAFLVGAAPGQDPKCAQSLRSIRLCAQQCDSQHCSYARGERESSSGCARRPWRERPIVQGRCAGRNRREHRPLGVVHHRAGGARDGEGIL